MDFGIWGFWELGFCVFVCVDFGFGDFGSPPMHGKTSEDFPYMGSLPTHGKSSYTWEVFQPDGHGKSSNTLEDFTYMGSLPIHAKSSYTWVVQSLSDVSHEVFVHGKSSHMWEVNMVSLSTKWA